MAEHDYTVRTLDTFAIGEVLIERQNDTSEYEYGIYDPEYDWGYAEDGTPVPPPCPIDGVLYNACTSPNYNPDEIFFSEE